MSDDFGNLVKFIREHLGESDDSIKNIEASLTELNERWESLSNHKLNKGIDDPHKIHLLDSRDLRDSNIDDWDEQEYQELSKLFYEIKHFIDKFQGLKIFKDHHQLNVENNTLEDEDLAEKSHVAYFLREARRKVLHFFSIITEDLANNRFYQKLQDWISSGADKFHEGSDLFEERLDLAKEDLISMLEHLEYKLLGRGSYTSNYAKNDLPISDIVKDALYSARKYYKTKKDHIVDSLEESIHSLGESIIHGKDYLAEKVGLKKHTTSSDHDHDHDVVWRDESKMQVSDHAPPDLRPKRTKTVDFEKNREELHEGFKKIFKQARDYVSAKVEKAKNLRRPEVIVDKVDEGIQSVKQNLGSVTDTIQEGADYISEKKDDAVRTVKDKLNLDKVSEYVGEKVEDVKKIPRKIGAKISEGVQYVGDKKDEVIDKVKDTLDLTKASEYVGEKVEDVKRIPEKVGAKIGEGVGYVSKKKDDLIESVKDKFDLYKASEYVGEKVEDVKQIPENIGAKIYEGVKYVGDKKDAVIDKVKDTFDLYKASEYVGEKVEDIKQIPENVGSKIREGVEYVTDELVEKTKDKLGINYVSEKIQEVKQIPHNIRNKIQEGVDYVKESVREAVEPPHPISGMKAKLGAIKDSIRDTIIDSKDFIVDSIVGGIDKLDEKKDELVNRVIDMTISDKEKVDSSFQKSGGSDSVSTHHEDEPHNSPTFDYEDSDLEEEWIDDSDESVYEKMKETTYKGKEDGRTDETSEKVKTGMQKLKEKLMKKVDESGPQLTEKQILDELSTYFHPNEPYMREFIDNFFKSHPKKSELPQTEESVWRRVKNFFKRKFGFGEPVHKDDTKYVETTKQMHPHHLDEKHLKRDHIYMDDNKDYLKDKRNQLLDELTGREDLFYYMADHGIDLYDVKEELLSYLLEHTDEGMSTWDDAPKEKIKKK